MSIIRPVLTGPKLARLTQDFDGSFYMERPGYLRTDITPHRGARWRWHPNAKYRTDLHLGEDYGAAAGTPVRAVQSGKIVMAGRDSTGGYFIYQQVRTGEVYKVIALYYHLQAGSIRVKAGQYVTQGTHIANVGNTGGSSTGAHCHFALVRYMRGVPASSFYRGANAKVSLGLTGVSFDPAPFYGANGLHLSKIAP